VLFRSHPELFVLISSVDVYNCPEDPTRNREDAIVDPLDLSLYGFHKALAELCVRRHAPRWMIIRLAGMVGPGLRKNPVHDILHEAPLRIHPDSRYQFMTTDAVAGVVWQLVRTGPAGAIYNVCGRGLISPREIAQQAGRTLNLSLLSADIRPRIVHVNTQKVGALACLPETGATVRAFLQEGF
jgi:nucleoside-diphosphate-sugar epimerase